MYVSYISYIHWRNINYIFFFLKVSNNNMMQCELNGISFKKSTKIELCANVIHKKCFIPINLNDFYP